MTPRRFFLVALLTAISLLARTALVAVSQNYTYPWPYCSTTDNYTEWSSYQANLVRLMADLQAGVRDHHGFYMSTAGEPPDTVFGLSMCYADSSWDQCQNCVGAATSGVQQTCPFSREMKASYIYSCVLRYSNESFFSVADLTVAYYQWTPTYVTDMVGMNATRWRLMSRIMGEACRSPQRLANQSEVINDSDGSSQLMYGFAQCTWDLTPSECTRCLTYLVVELSNSRPNNTYGGVRSYSCYVVYQIGGELGLMLLPPSPPAEATEPSSPPLIPPSPAEAPEPSSPPPVTTPHQQG